MLIILNKADVMALGILRTTAPSVSQCSDTNGMSQCFVHRENSGQTSKSMGPTVYYHIIKSHVKKYLLPSNNEGSAMLFG